MCAITAISFKSTSMSFVVRLSAFVFVCVCPRVVILFMNGGNQLEIRISSRHRFQTSRVKSEYFHCNYFIFITTIVIIYHQSSSVLFFQSRHIPAACRMREQNCCHHDHQGLLCFLNSFFFFNVFYYPFIFYLNVMLVILKFPNADIIVIRLVFFMSPTDK